MNCQAPQQHSRIKPALFLLLLFSAVLLPSAGTAVEEKRRPNFVFIFLDDAGWGDFGCYGNAYTQTPYIDRMAEAGTLFTDGYVNSPVCSPSRVAALTGRYPGRLGVHHIQWGNLEKYGMANAVAEDVVWLTQVLQKAGYRTGHFGKWHIAHTSQGPDPSAYGIDDHRTSISPGPGWDRKDNNLIAKEDELIFEEGLRFIEENREKPFYLNLWAKRPHTPIAPSEEQMSKGEYADWKASGFGAPLPFTTPHRQYAATMTEIDRLVGVFMERLKALGLDENTLVLLSSDNGPEYLNVKFNASVGSAGPFRGLKRSLYEGGIRVPFIAVWPGHIPAGKVNHSSVISVLDWFPTVCHLAGVPVPDGLCDGEDMSDVLLGSDRDRASPLLWEFRFPQGSYQVINRSPMLAIRDGAWKLLMNPDRSRVELYNLADDPMEVDNVAPAHADVVERLSKPLMEFHQSLPKGPVHPQAGKNTYPWPRQKNDS
jgi:N-acetylgalactosamine-6-sulfatase